MKTILLIGLGNPGKKYEKTRHNAGFIFADNFRSDKKENFSEWEFSKKLNSEISTGKSNGIKIILMKPRTFMNLSGEAVASAKKYYKVKLEDIFVVHDEIDLPLGSFRFSKDSSAAGHQGVQNIIDLLGTKNFTRLRIGTENRKAPASSADKKKIPTDKYVLGKFACTETRVLLNTLKEAIDELRKKI